MTQILSNAHTHTVFCDGKNTPREMANKALELHFISLGFSVHSPLDYENDYALDKARQNEYNAEIDALKNELDGSLEILSGVEYDLDSHIDLSDYDFAIGSVHQFHDGYKVYANDGELSDLQLCYQNVFNCDGLQMTEEYYRLVVQNALRDGIDIVGHFDLITKLNNSNRFFDESDKRYRQQAISAAERILRERDIIFEINTGAMARGIKALPYPAPFILEYLSSKNAKIMINSDSHSVDTLDFGFEKAIKLCKSCGISSIYRIRKSGFEKLAI